MFCIDVSILVVASFISYALISNLTFAILVIINYGSYFFMGKKIYLIPGLFVNYLVCFLLLFLFLIFVKNFFEVFKFKEKDAGALRAMIYGSDANAIFVANAL